MTDPQMVALIAALLYTDEGLGYETPRQAAASAVHFLDQAQALWLDRRAQAPEKGGV